MVARYQAWRPKSEQEVRSFIREQAGCVPGMPGIWYQLGIVRVEDGSLLGDCGILVPVNSPTDAELGITLRADAWKRGYATEVLRALLHYCFERLHLSRVLARIRPGNVAAIMLVERHGFVFRGNMQMRFHAADDDVFDLLYSFDRPDTSQLDWNARE